MDALTTFLPFLEGTNFTLEELNIVVVGLFLMVVLSLFGVATLIWGICNHEKTYHRSERQALQKRLNQPPNSRNCSLSSGDTEHDSGT